ncbi:MAG: rRNA maturation RNase YbeY [bacterium]|nr:rRNA maturation RNase YbeY [bacterium]
MATTASRSSTPVVQIFSAHPYGTPDLRKLKSLAQKVIAREGLLFPVNVIIADDSELERLNRQFLKEEETTDVIAFAPDETGTMPAEVYANLDQARIQALEHGESVQKALARLVAHGILHLGGWDDATDEQRIAMLAHGEEYLT